MDVSYILRGLHDPHTVVEITGSVYFHNNSHTCYYKIDTVVLEGGRLCIYYNTEDVPESLARDKRHHIKVEPNIESVEFVLKEYEPVKEGTAHVVFYIVTSLYTPASGQYFRYRKYEADLDRQFGDNISYNVTSEYLVEKCGFACTDEYDDYDKETIVVYHRKD